MAGARAPKQVARNRMNEFIPASRQPNPENTEPSGAQPTTRSHWDIWNKPGTVGAVGIPGASGAQVSGSPPRLATSGEFDAWSTTKPSVFLSGEEANRNDYHYQETGGDIARSTSPFHTGLQQSRHRQAAAAQAAALIHNPANLLDSNASMGPYHDPRNRGKSLDMDDIQRRQFAHGSGENGSTHHRYQTLPAHDEEAQPPQNLNSVFSAAFSDSGPLMLEHQPPPPISSSADPLDTLQGPRQKSSPPTSYDPEQLEPNRTFGAGYPNNPSNQYDDPNVDANLMANLRQMNLNADEPDPYGMERRRMYQNYSPAVVNPYSAAYGTGMSNMKPAKIIDFVYDRMSQNSVWAPDESMGRDSHIFDAYNGFEQASQPNYRNGRGSGMRHEYNEFDAPGDLQRGYFGNGSTAGPPAQSHQSGRGSSINGSVFDKKLRLRQQMMSGQQGMSGGRDLRPNVGGSNFPEYGGFNAGGRGASHYPLPAHSPSLSTGSASGRKPDDMGQNMRSAMLEDFRNSKARKFELKDIVGHVVEFSGDQHGSRFIQQKLENASNEEKEAIFNEILGNSLQLMTDVFGNYCVQKFFEHGNQMQKTILAKQMEGHVLSLSLNLYGCRVLQKALEHILTEQQASLVGELDGHVLKCVKDQNGNHVLQKAIERVPPEHIQFILDAIQGQIYSLATHAYGCRVIQRMLEHCTGDAKIRLMEELHHYMAHLIQDSYGNYVAQHVIERGTEDDRARIFESIRGQILPFSKHKFASNVVEKCISYANREQKAVVIAEVIATKDGTSAMTIMMKDQFANYVIQKLLECSDGEMRQQLVTHMKPQLQALKKYSYGKHLISIERLITLSGDPTGHLSPSAHIGGGYDFHDEMQANMNTAFYDHSVIHQ